MEESAFQLPVNQVALPGIREVSDSLDPFCQLPNDLTLEERRLFRSCGSFYVDTYDILAA
jgi:hypothetical protein